jgi:hemolysin III
LKDPFPAWSHWAGVLLSVAAAVGIATVYRARARTHWPRVLCYVVMGWLGVVAAGPLFRVLPPAAIAWLIGGGVIYTVGAAVFLTRRPRLWPGTFGSHDLWHCMVLAGSACHYLVILKYVLPRP